MRLLIALLGLLIPTAAFAGANPAALLPDDPTKLSMLGLGMIIVYGAIIPLLMLAACFGMKRTFIAVGVLFAGLSVSGCQSTDWGKFAAGTGLVLSSIPATQQIDPKIAKASEQIARYCPALQIIGVVAGAYLEKQRAAIIQVNAAVNEVCLTPVKDAPAAAIVLARAYEAAVAAKLTTAAGS